MNGESISITRYAWYNNAIKRKNAMTQPYNYHAERFKTFMETNCISVVDKAVKYAIANSSDRIKKLKEDVSAREKEWYGKKAELDIETAKLSSTDSLRGIIYDKIKDIGPRDSGSSTIGCVGIYAALMGYDGIYVHNGNTGNHGFNVILNRTKVITSVEQQDMENNNRILLWDVINSTMLYIDQKHPSQLLPFKGKFPILNPSQMDLFRDACAGKTYMDEMPNWAQQAIIKAQRIATIERSFQEYLIGRGILPKLRRGLSSSRNGTAPYKLMTI